MKTKTMLMPCLMVIVASLMSLNVMAQSSDVLLYKTTGDTIKVGDVVKISKDYERYETKEHIIHWAFDSTHVIRQVNSKFHPNAVLLKRIYSWIPADAAVFVSRAEEQKPKVVKEKTVKYDTIIRIDTLIHRIDTLRRIDTICGPGKTPIKIDTVYIHDTIWDYKYDTIFVPVPNVCPDCDTVVRGPEPWGVRNRFSIGLRGGFASNMAQPFPMPLGYDVRLDLQYAHYWKTASPLYVGIMTGVSAGYMNTLRHRELNEYIPTEVMDGGLLVKVNYNITGDLYEQSQQVQVEVPLMFSMVTESGLYFNVGPRFLLPILTPYQQYITNGNVQAQDVTTEPSPDPVNNNIIYGMFTSDQLAKKGESKQKYSWTITAGFELGYEFHLASGHSIGLGAYANYGIYNSNYGLYDFKAKESSSPISVTPPQGPNNGVVTVHPLTDVTSMYGHLDAGIKISYNFDFK